MSEIGARQGRRSRKDRLNDKECFDVAEYCISEGGVKVPAGQALDRRCTGAQGTPS